MAFAANQMPIMTAARRTGATWLTRERPPDPTGSRFVPRNRAVSSLFRPCGPPSPASGRREVGTAFGRFLGRPIGDRHSSPIPCSFRRPAPQSQARWRQGKLLHFRKRRRAGVKRDSEVPDTQFFAWLLELAAFSRLFVGRNVASCIV